MWYSTEAGAKGLLEPSAAEVDSEQELLKGCVGPSNISLSLRAYHLSASRILFPPPAVILP